MSVLVALFRFGRGPSGNFARRRDVPARPAEPFGEALADGLGDAERVVLALADGLGDAERVVLALAVGDTEWVGLALAVGDTEWVGLALGMGLRDAERVGLALWGSGSPNGLDWRWAWG